MASKSTFIKLIWTIAYVNFKYGSVLVYGKFSVYPWCTSDSGFVTQTAADIW